MSNIDAFQPIPLPSKAPCMLDWGSLVLSISHHLPPPSHQAIEATEENPVVNRRLKSKKLHAIILWKLMYLL